jgi:hypothetical protein
MMTKTFFINCKRGLDLDENDTTNYVLFQATISQVKSEFSLYSVT